MSECQNANLTLFLTAVFIYCHSAIWHNNDIQVWSHNKVIKPMLMTLLIPVLVVYVLLQCAEAVGIFGFISGNDWEVCSTIVTSFLSCQSKLLPPMCSCDYLIWSNLLLSASSDDHRLFNDKIILSSYNYSFGFQLVVFTELLWFGCCSLTTCPVQSVYNWKKCHKN